MLLRLTRLLRLLRLLRLVRTLQGFDSLYLMTTAIRSSLSVLFWSFILLGVVQGMLALLLNQVLMSTFFNDESRSIEVRKQMFVYFGTFARSLLSMFEITLGNWVPVARLLSENLSFWFMLFSILHKLSLGFAILGVINGVFISETFKVAANDDAVMMMQKQRASQTHAKKMGLFFKNADISDDGWVDKTEFQAVMQEPMVQHWLAAQELDASDADALFFHLDLNHDTKISAMEIVEGVAKLKGPARNFDLFKIQAQQLENQAATDKTIGKISDTIIALRCVVHDLHGTVHDLHGKVTSHIARESSENIGARLYSRSLAENADRRVSLL